MKEMVAELKARGYWQTVLRPTAYVANRISDRMAVVNTLSGIAVSLRGWSFPHIDMQQPPIIEQGWIGQVLRWRYFHECWRLTNSGQWFHVAGMRHDWGAERQLAPLSRVDDSSRILGIGDTLFRFTEMLIFSSRFANTYARGEGVDAEFEVGGLADRQLVVDDPGRMAAHTYISRAQEPFRMAIHIDEALTEDRLLGVARESAGLLFEMFNCRLAPAVLEDWQRKIRNY